MTEHQLWSSFTLWILNKNKSLSNDSYSQQLHPYCSFQSIEQFYSVYSYMNVPTTVYQNDTHTKTTDTVIFHVFRTGIQPLWEDPANANGGRLIIRIKKYLHITSENTSENVYIDRLYEDLLLMLIGDTYNLNNDLCGIVLTQKNNTYNISIWNSDSSDNKVNKLKQAVKHTLNIPQHIVNSVVEYIPHNVNA